MMALVIAIVSLGVMIVTLFITMRMLMYMKKSDLMKSKQSVSAKRKQILEQIKVKERQLKSLNDYTMFPVEHTAIDNIRTQKLMLESEIKELYNQL